jgi:hypothetical protein
LGPAPVFGGETVESDILDGVLVEVFYHPAHVFSAGPVTVESGQSAMFRPPSVTIGDNGQMGGEFGQFWCGWFLGHFILKSSLDLCQFLFFVPSDLLGGGD